LPNGGCYDGSGQTFNKDGKTTLYVYDNGQKKYQNTCDPSLTTQGGKPASIRPWIIFQGALQLGVSQ
jgi:hypothetical protein